MRPRETKRRNSEGGVEREICRVLSLSAKLEGVKVETGRKIKRRGGGGEKRGVAIGSGLD